VKPASVNFLAAATCSSTSGPHGTSWVTASSPTVGHHGHQRQLPGDLRCRAEHGPRVPGMALVLQPREVVVGDDREIKARLLRLGAEVSLGSCRCSHGRASAVPWAYSELQIVFSYSARPGFYDLTISAFPFSKAYELWAGIEKILTAEFSSSTVSSGPERV
jgi:hypothetical protein